MASIDRNARRQLQAEIKARAKTVLLTGLPKQARPLDLLALAAVIHAALPKPAKAAEIAHTAFETSARVGAPTQQLACKKGCAFCCHGTVTITAPEAFRLASALRERGNETIATFKQNAANTVGKSPSERLGAKWPCPFLENSVCSVYHTRPIACRQVTSFNLTPCLDEFEGHDGDIQIPEHYTSHAGNAQVAVAAALLSAQKPVKFYELSSSVLAALDTPNAEHRWLQGEDVFAGAWEDNHGVAGIEKAARILTEPLRGH